MIEFDDISANNTSQRIKFTFDANPSNPFLKDKIDRRNALASRLNKLVNEPTIGGHPFIKYAIQSVPVIDPEELRVVAKALARVAELWEPFQRLDQEVRGLVFAKDNASLMALAFGDFEEVPEDADEFLRMTRTDPKQE